MISWDLPSSSTDMIFSG